MIRKMLKSLLGENFTENNAKLASVNFAIVHHTALSSKCRKSEWDA